MITPDAYMRMDAARRAEVLNEQTAALSRLLLAEVAVRVRARRPVAAGVRVRRDPDAPWTILLAGVRDADDQPLPHVTGVTRVAAQHLVGLACQLNPALLGEHDLPVTILLPNPPEVS